MPPYSSDGPLHIPCQGTRRQGANIAHHMPCTLSGKICERNTPHIDYDKDSPPSASLLSRGAPSHALGEISAYFCTCQCTEHPCTRICKDENGCPIALVGSVNNRAGAQAGSRGDGPSAASQDSSIKRPEITGPGVVVMLNDPIEEPGPNSQFCRCRGGARRVMPRHRQGYHRPRVGP